MGEGRGDTDLYADAGARIMELYRQRIDGRSKTGEEGVPANSQTTLASWSEKSICSRRAP
jgi:hypothetical protein